MRGKKCPVKGLFCPVSGPKTGIIGQNAQSGGKICPEFVRKKACTKPKPVLILSVLLRGIKEVERMPNIKSQKDRVIQSAKEQARNKAIKSNLKTVVKKADAAIASGAEDKDAALKAAVSAIDKAQTKGVLHKNTAARKVSRLAKRANKAEA